MSERVYNVHAQWDGNARCWVATSDDVPGLATGADTLDELVKKLRTAIPDLLEANGRINDGDTTVPFSLHQANSTLKQAGLRKAF